MMRPIEQSNWFVIWSSMRNSVCFIIIPHKFEILRFQNLSHRWLIYQLCSSVINIHELVNILRLSQTLHRC